MRTCLALLVVGLLVGASAADEPESESTRLLAEADRVFRTRDYAAATAHYEKAAAAAEKEQDRATRVEALSMVARGYLIRDMGTKGRPFLDRAGALAEVGVPRGWSRYLGVRGRFEWKDGDKPTATKTFEAMYAYCVEHDLFSRAVDAAHMAAITGTHEQQVAWARKGIAAAEKGKLDSWLGPLWNNLGNTYHELGEHAEALNAFERARHYHWKTGTETNKLIADWAVGMAHRKLGQHQHALEWLRPVLAWAERLYAEEHAPERGEWVGLALMELGLVYLAQGRPIKARRHLEAALPLLAAVKMEDWHPVAWKELTGALAQLSGKRSWPSVTEGAVRARVQMQMFAQAVDLYRLTNKKLPLSLEVLAEPDAASGQPYLGSLPKDPWGHDYEYRILDRSKYRIRSYGSDGEPDSADDIVFPAEAGAK